MEETLIGLAGANGHYGYDYSEYRHLHTYVERPDNFDEKLYADDRILNHAHFYELDEIDEESLQEKFTHLHKLVTQEIIDFCRRNDIDAEYVHFGADGLMSSIEFGSWHPGTDSSFSLHDKNKKAICYSM